MPQMANKIQSRSHELKIFPIKLVVAVEMMLKNEEIGRFHSVGSDLMQIGNLRITWKVNKSDM